MFNKTTLVMGRTRTEYVDRHVAVERAPTDESVALLAEFEAAARAKIVASVNCGDNGFECVVHMMRDFASDDVTLMAVFTLNGKKMTVTVREPERTATQKRMAELLFAAVSEKISQEVVIDGMRAVWARLPLGAK